MAWHAAVAARMLLPLVSVFVFTGIYVLNEGRRSTNLIPTQWS